MTGGQHEAVAVAPDWMVGVEAQNFCQTVYMTGASAIGVRDARSWRPARRPCTTCGSCRWRASRWDRFPGREIGGGLGHGQPSSVRDPQSSGRGQSVVVGGQACLNARYRPRLSA